MLHVRFVRCTLYYMCVHCVTRTVCEGHVLRVRFYATHVLYHNECFGIVKISHYFSYKVKFDIKTFVGTH